MIEQALKRPYTAVVVAILIALLGGVAIKSMATDIFPEINVPVVSVIWTYPGLPPQEMERRVVTISERAYTTTVNDMDHMESQSMSGISVIKIYFHPEAKVEAAVAQLTSTSMTVLKSLPPGITPPLILRYNASDVPILQLAVASSTLSEEQLYDYALNFIRTQLATVQGASVPSPYGGKVRQIMVDLNLPALEARKLTPMDVVNAVNAQNLILPSGAIKIGKKEFNVQMNSSPDIAADLNDIPVGNSEEGTVFVRDVGQVHDGYAVQTNIVRQNGKRSSLLTIMKTGGASTLDVVARVKQVLPRIQATLPPSLKLDALFDQSLFVRAAVEGVVREAALAALLTAGMILIFLGDWRSTLIVIATIPLSILGSIVLLGALGQTLNVMTLGGLALAVGILVDDATVSIENIHRNLEKGMPKYEAVLRGAEQIVVPAIVSTVSIAIVFVPILLLTGASRSLFGPMALAVVFALGTSFILARTLVPVMANYLLHDHGNHQPIGESHFRRFQTAFEKRFHRIRLAYRAALGFALGHGRMVTAGFAVFWISALILLPFVGQDFFPSVDAGQFRLHVRTPPGTRIEETEREIGDVESAIRKVVPPEELDMIVDKIGLPASGSALAFIDPAAIGASDAEILVSLKEDHASTWKYMARLRQQLGAQFPQLTFFFQPADIVGQILNFGLSSPIDIQIVGRDQDANYRLARKVTRLAKTIPGAVDVHLHQVMDAPQITLTMDRSRANLAGVTARDMANNVLVSLSSSGVVAPNYWLNPKTGVSYLLALQVPQYALDTTEKIQSIPVSGAGHKWQPVANLGTIGHGAAPAVVNHYDVQPLFDVFVTNENRDLGSVAADVDRIVESVKGELPRGSFIAVRGQVQTMRDSFRTMIGGMAFAVILVYLVLVLNFQSWTDSLIILAALPNAMAGIVWILFSTNTTFSVPALLGSIMTIGVGTANSILLVTFAKEVRASGRTTRRSALEAGFVRFRPVIMTALAMILGMLPMALGLGEGGEQNAPLGRAIIGGLTSATIGTLFLVPMAFSRFSKATGGAP